LGHGQQSGWGLGDRWRYLDVTVPTELQFEMPVFFGAQFTYTSTRTIPPT
jgi:hypothetical protein